MKYSPYLNINRDIKLLRKLVKTHETKDAKHRRSVNNIGSSDWANSISTS